MGIIFPAVDTPEQALDAVRAMRYPQRRDSSHVEPRGRRGSGPAAAAWFWGLSTGEYIRHADVWPLNPSGDLLAIMMIESVEGLRNVQAIAAVPGVSGFYIGPSDLSNSLGVSRDDQEVEEAIEMIVSACRDQSIACGITASAADMPRRVEQGFRILGAGRAGGGLSASADAALRAGRDAR
jgi:4-hydroxy-2-oxoheptanedioate aldolase